MSSLIQLNEEALRCAIGKEFTFGIQKLGKPTVEKWVIRPGMEFASPHIWWGDTSKTRYDSYGGGPHEGLDFALAQKVDTRPFQAGLQGLAVSALLRGRVLWRFDDLVGDTLIVASDYQSQGYRFLVQYSHIDSQAVPVGSAVELGQNLGTIKRSDNLKSVTASHLHVSTAFLNEDLVATPDSSVTFDHWLQWESSGKLHYLDPLSLVAPEVRAAQFIIGREAKSPIARLVSTGSSRDDRAAIRRVLARAFPGIQSLNAKNAEAAKELTDSDSILVSNNRELWKIEYTGNLQIPSTLELSGYGFKFLVDTISLIEYANANI